VTDTRHESFEPLDDIEALLRSAEDYVRPSEDLRPRVLEAARAQRGEQRAVSWVRYAAIAAAAAGALISSTFEPGMAASMGALPVTTVAQGGDFGWNLVESFTELRRRQAELLRPAQRRPGA
jgi:hypothetical protein